MVIITNIIKPTKVGLHICVVLNIKVKADSVREAEWLCEIGYV